MSTTPHDRPSPPTRVELRPPPPLLPREGSAGLALNALPMLGSVGSIVLVASMSGASSTTRLIAAGMFGVATLGFVAVQVDRQRRQRQQRVGGARLAYLRHLAAVRRTVRTAASRQRTEQFRTHPDPPALVALAAEGSRTWERGPSDPDFLRVRCGVGPQRLELELVAPAEAEGPAEPDPVAVTALERLLAVHRTQPDLPAVVDLRATTTVEVDHAGARALLCQAVAFHAPEHLRVAVLADPEALPAWDWVKWLPHARGSRNPDAADTGPIVAAPHDAVASLLPDEAEPRAHLLIVLDGASREEALGPSVPGDAAGVTVLEVSTNGERDGAATVAPDRCSVTTAEALARRLAPREGRGRAVGSLEDYPSLLGISLVGDNPRRTTPRTGRDRLRVPIGTDDEGRPVHLDLKESAQQGMGPHGLVVGATGSGKSEFLRTLVVGLALTHTPDELNLVLVDFKGGATFAGLAELPQTSAVITNLARELPLVDRMQDALAGELVRRQEVLREAGDFASLHAYDTARAAGADLPPLPALLVVVDEFSELLAAKPEFADLFVTIGRLGRSLGLHLLLASQRLEEGRLRGLEAHLSYRVGLRTFSAAESRAAIGVPDAHRLPAVPGIGYLRPDPTTLTRFRSAYVSGPMASPAGETRSDEPVVLPFALAPVRARPDADNPRALGADSDTARTGADRPSVLETAVDHLRADPRRARRIWLPPLDEAPALHELLTSQTAPLTVPVGVVDRPREQRRDVLAVDLSGAGGHVAVVGAPHSGKSTLLQGLLAGVALTMTPQETQFFVLDLGGGTFRPWADLPHVSAVAQRHRPDVVRRLVAEVTELVERREARGSDGSDGTDAYGEVFVVVDGWGELRAEYDDAAAALQRIAVRGLGVGIHLLVSATRWADFRASLRDVLGTRLELRLGDPLESEIDRRVSAQVPRGRPGRGITMAKEHFLATVPDVHAVASALADVGPAAPRLRLLPERVTAREVTAGADDPRLLLGLAESTLAPVGLDVETEPHLLVLGEGGAGKSTTLRGLLREVLRTRGADAAQVVLLDPRRSLLGEVPPDQLLHHLSTAREAEKAVRELASYLTGRLPGPDVTPQQLRRRSWWSGAEVFVVVDDHDLITTGAAPLAPLLPLLPQAGDVGLRIAVARRTGGAARALHDPVLQSLRDLAMPGLLLSGSPDEGPLLGRVRAEPAAPGRAKLVTREGGTQVMQVTWTDPAL